MVVSRIFRTFCDKSFIWSYGENQDPAYNPYDAAAEWRGFWYAYRYPFTPLRELGKRFAVRPIGRKKKEAQLE